MQRKNCRNISLVNLNKELIRKKMTAEAKLKMDGIVNVFILDSKSSLIEAINAIEKSKKGLQLF